jgi:hypothetical protein
MMLRQMVLMLVMSSVAVVRLVRKRWLVLVLLLRRLPIERFNA